MSNVCSGRDGNLQPEKVHRSGDEIPTETRFCSRQKPDGSYWDLTKSEDVEEVERIVEGDKPELLTGSPLCHMFSQLQNISWHKISPEVQEKRMTEAIHHLHVSCKMYRKQYDAGRTFLHEAPWGASSWKDPEIQAILVFPGVKLAGTWTNVPVAYEGYRQARSSRDRLRSKRNRLANERRRLSRTPTR